ncbi:MAG TPA: nuclear transport factor 2 family protein [Verrucomicrobiae bacterium]|nr:nuclear transport factor 2 family protein [Verrucomicrobiae bacterium]
MHPNAQLIERFYQAFQKRDAAGMVACYDRDVHFSDPVFPDLHGPHAGAMWTMLCERGKDLTLEYRDVRADNARGAAHWDARYTFATTGRPVLNRIDASFRFKDGLIIRHVDRFDLHAWAGQALGLSGKLLGWTPMVQNKIRGMAGNTLAAFETGRV